MNPKDKEESWLRKMAAHMRKEKRPDSLDDVHDGDEPAEDEDAGAGSDDAASSSGGTRRKKKRKSSDGNGCSCLIRLIAGAAIGWWLFSYFFR